MKKVLCLVLAMMMVLTGLVFAACEEAVPSKTQSGMYETQVTVENPENADGFIFVIVFDEEDSIKEASALTRMPVEEIMEEVLVNEKEIDALTEAGSAEAYFADATDAYGNKVDVKAMIGADTLNVNEMVVAIVLGYKEEFGTANVSMLFPTPYEDGEKVAVMIGFVKTEDDGSHAIDWVAVEGSGVKVEEDVVKICADFNPELLLKMQESTTLLAIASK